MENLLDHKPDDNYETVQKQVSNSLDFKNGM